MDETLCYEYTPARIRRILYRWPEYLALAETPASAAGLTVDGPTPESPRIRQIGHHSDPLAWANLIADVERAWTSLALHSIEWRAVEMLMQGKRLDTFARVMHLDLREVEEGLDRATEAMALTLGYRPESGDGDVEVVRARSYQTPSPSPLTQIEMAQELARRRLQEWRAGR